MDLAWVPDSSAIVVDERWLVQPGGAFLALPVPGATHLFSPDESRIAIVQAENDLPILRVTDASGQAGPRIRIPDPPFAGGFSRVTRAIWWLDGTRIALVQAVDSSGTPIVDCRVLDVDTGAWADGVGCPVPPQGNLRGVAAGGGVVAFHTASDNGLLAVSLYRWDGRSDAQPLRTPWDQVLVDDLRVAISADGASGVAVSGCAINKNRPCEALPGQPLRWYRFKVDSGGASVRGKSIPPDALPAPDGEQLAWTEDGKVCFGDPGAKGASAPECWALPTLGL